ncbi:MAG: hypothetical protein NVSMB65_01500 [Chloroflexota bacterium]
MATRARLHGETIALLEARRTSELSALIAARGGTPLAAPALREDPIGDDASIGAFLDMLARGDVEVVVLQTGVGTRALLETAERLARKDELIAALKRRTVAVRGPKPTAALRQVDIVPQLTAADPYTTAQLLEALEPVALRNVTVAVQQYGEANEDLRRMLEARGARVLDLALYRWALPEDEGPVLDLLDALARGTVACLVVTSQAQVAHLFVIAAKHGRGDELRRTLAGPVVVAAVGPVAARALEDRGVEVDLVASPPKMGALVLAIAERLAPVPSH